MTPTADSFALGHPRFAGASASNVATEEATLAAWRQALQQSPTHAVASVGGDFAVALQLADQSFAAVDRFAVRTLCWRVGRDGLHMAPRADQLADAEPEIDSQSIYDYLYFHAVPSPRTVFRDIYRLPPGHCLRFADGRLDVAPFWRPEFHEGKPAFAALRDEFRGLLHQAVRRQLDGSRPACFLSGGTDSSTVAGVIGEISGTPPLTYSIGFDAAGYDEMAYARLAAKHFGTEHHEYYVTPDDLVTHIPGVAAHFDQPFGNSSALPAYLCQLRAREDGVTRMLAGDGGDELFGGNSRYATQRVFGWYDHVPSAARSGLLEPVLQRSPLGRAPLLRKGASYIAQARVPLPDRLQTYNLLQRLGAERVLTPAFLTSVDVGDPSRQQREVWAQAGPGTSEVNRMLAFDWRYTLAESDLPKVCGAAALAGMEVAFPLLDDDLLDFSLRLPTAYKLRGLRLRWFFKEALRGFLPDEIIRKRKHGFGLPFGVWLAQHAGLRELAQDTLDGIVRRGVVRADFASALFTTHLAEHPSYYGELVWILMVLEIWLRRHAGGWHVGQEQARQRHGRSEALC
jgi:asparagine synthase (glutamine-hydrolysing)